MKKEVQQFNPTEIRDLIKNNHKQLEKYVEGMNTEPQFNCPLMSFTNDPPSTKKPVTKVINP